MVEKYCSPPLNGIEIIRLPADSGKQNKKILWGTSRLRKYLDNNYHNEYGKPSGLRKRLFGPTK